MKDREISPSGSEIQPGTQQASSLVEILTPRVRFPYPTWTLMMDFDNLIAGVVIIFRVNLVTSFLDRDCFWKEKIYLIADLHKTDLVIWGHSKKGKPRPIAK